MADTLENLKNAFAGESQANRKYLAFAKKADQDGFPQVAKLFRAAAEAETIHALAHLSAMGGVGTTAENLKAAVCGETYEFKEMYPPMLAQAQKEGHKAKVMFGFALKAEEVHAGLYQRALDSVVGGEDLEVLDVRLCPCCGHIVFGKPQADCPICGAKTAKYRKVD
ncbi:MAG: rubrerythrin family protein [Elusimicrobia bacterium]|nr:rubrerythrin family protein [Elusimicrobiota bacterium]